MYSHIPNVLSTEQIRTCRELLAAVGWTDGRGSAGPVAARMKNNFEVPKTDPNSTKLRDIILAALMSKQNFVATALPAKLVLPSFSRYEKGQSYGPHVDASVMDVIENGGLRRIRTDLAATLFISEPAEYEGGELMIEDPLYGQGKVKLPAGDMILYPASSQHWVEPITKGVRLVSFFWIQSMVRENSLRAMLQDLDSTIQMLNRSTPDNPANVRLLCLYHNLLRLWSET
jgi:PKHD-type hydroxylase